MTGEEVFPLDLVHLLSSIFSDYHGFKVMSEELGVGCQVQFKMPVKYLGVFIKWALILVLTMCHEDTWMMSIHLCKAVNPRSLSACVWDCTSLLRTECCWRLDSWRTSKSDSNELRWSERSHGEQLYRLHITEWWIWF